MTIRSLVWALLVACGSLAASGCAAPIIGDPRPYESRSDASAEIAAALADNPDRHRVLLTFGANWCHDSRSLERRYRSPKLAALLAREFRVVHVDIGYHHRNLDLVARYGNPTDKGIPSVVLLDADGNTLWVNHGHLSSIADMGDKDVLAFFERLARDGRAD